MRALTRPFRIVGFALYFLRELVVANLRVARDVLSPGMPNLRAGIVRFPTRTRPGWERTTLANAITMTPGTLTLEVDDAHDALYVHTLYAEDREAFTASLQAMEHHLLRALR